jgi:hypothetical protein
MKKSFEWSSFKRLWLCIIEAAKKPAVAAQIFSNAFRELPMGGYRSLIMQESGDRFSQ